LGSFSYAEIPCSNFAAILGVTGTLETLSAPEKTVIENVYGIKFQTIIPSVYGRNNLRFDPKSNVCVSSEENHFQLIAREIQKKLVGQNVGTKRAVFLFFESKQELEAFYRSDAFLPYKSESHILTEEANAHEKTYFINAATMSGKITLCTRTFGRGTDFITHDQIVSVNGGVHVIQTFLSEEYAEEIQIRGRTARQGEDGSYSLIVNVKSLEKFLISPEELHALNGNNLYAFLDKKRNEFFSKQYNENTKYIDSIKEKHIRSNKFLENIFKQNLNEVSF
jgi:preprotein translocase subunit SecA